MSDVTQKKFADGITMQLNTEGRIGRSDEDEAMSAMTNNQQGEYLVVIVTDGDGEGMESGIRIHSVRCNQKRTAEAIVDWEKEKAYSYNPHDVGLSIGQAKLFHDPIEERNAK
jgi:hypothetical protein